MDGALKGSLGGLSLGHEAHHLYRALIEATACGVRWIVELLDNGGVPVRKLVATGGLPHHNPLLVQVYADVLGKPILVHPCKHGPALGAAILGALAAGKRQTGLGNVSAAIRAMAQPRDGDPGRTAKVVVPIKAHRQAYAEVYRRYRELAAFQSQQRT